MIGGIVFIAALIRQSHRITVLEKDVRAFSRLNQTSGQMSGQAAVQAATQSNVAQPSSNTVQPTPGAVRSDPLIPPIAPKTASGYNPHAPHTPYANAAVPQLQVQQTEVHKEESAGVILGRIGIGAVVLGSIFFLKYAFDNNWIGEAGRIMLGLVGGAGIFALGHYLYAKYQEYGAILMGGGVTILYFSVYAAYDFYQLIPMSAAYTGFIVITAVVCIVSAVLRAQSLLVIASIGAFLAPLIFDLQTTSFLGVATYITIAAIGISTVILRRGWTYLAYLPAIGIALVFSTWYAAEYSSTMLAIVAVFALAWTTMFVGMGIALMTQAQSEQDKTGIVLTTLAYFFGAVTLYTLFVREYSDYLGIGAVLGALHAGIAAYIAHTVTQGKVYVSIVMAGIMATFLTVAVQLQFDGVWVGVAWVVESLVLYYLASRIQDRGFQIMGAIVFALGAGSILINEWTLFNPSKPFVPILNTGFFAMMLATIIAGIIAFIYYRSGSITKEIQKRGITVFFVVANVFFLLTVTSQVTKFYSYLASAAYDRASNQAQTALMYSGRSADSVQDEAFAEANKISEKLGNTANTIIYIFYAIYAAFLTLVGFVKRVAGPRKLGLVLFVFTMVLVIARVWSLGPIYKIVATIGVGALALIASFVYAKYKDRLIGTTAALVLGIALFGAAAQAAYEPQMWQYSQDIEYNGANSTRPFVEVVIPESVTGVDPQGSSIRIVRNGIEEVSYAVVHRTTFATDEVQANILNTSSRDGNTFALLDVGTNSVYSGITLRIRNNNFNRQVKVYAADSQIGLDSTGWRLVSDAGYIYSFQENISGGVRQAYTTVNLPKMTSRYLKIEIVAGTEGALIIDGVRIESSAESVIPRTYTHTVEQTVTLDPKTKASIVTADLGRLYNVSEIGVSLGEGNFARQATVLTSVDGKDYSQSGVGRLYSLRSQTFTGSINTIEFAPVVARYIKIVIANGDSAPLDFGKTLRVKGPLGSLIFDGSVPGNYELVYGNPRALAPNYDTQELARFISAQEVVRAYLGDVKVNAEYMAPVPPKVPFAVQYPHALTIVVVVFVILGLGLIAWYILRINNSTEIKSTGNFSDSTTEQKEQK